MDSLLVVLIVVGVVMILAGVARMRSKRRHSWDEIDHSVLFSKDDQDHDIDMVVSSAVVVKAENKPEAGYQKFDGLVNAQETEAVAEGLEIHVEDERDVVSPPLNPVADRARSMLGKLRGENKIDVDSDSLEPNKKVYKEDTPDKVVVLNVMEPQG